MIRIISIICCALLLGSCGGKEQKAQAEGTSSQIQAASTGISKSMNSAKKEACDYLPKDVLARIMGWEPSNTTSELLMSLEDRDITVCNLVHGEDKLMIRMAWKSEKAQAKKALERNYQTYLKKGEENLTYRELNAGANMQTIFGSGKDRSGKGWYILRRRSGNAIDIQLEALSANAEEKAVLHSLQKIVANMGV